MRAVLLRYLAVVGIGIALLAVVLFIASTVDGRPPVVEDIGLTLHSSDDDRLALTTTSIEVRFSELVRIDSAEAAFRIEPETAGQFSWSGPVLRFTPSQRLPLETGFSVTVAAGVVDEAGNRMEDDASAFAFTTVGPPQVAATLPEDGAIDVPLDTEIVLEFTNLMDTALVEEAIRIVPALAYEARWSAEQVSLVPTTGLREATRYVVSVGTDARDAAGIPIEGAFDFSFETTSSPVRVTQLVPANGIEGVATTSAVAVVLDRALDAEADVEELFTIEPDVAGTLEVVPPPGGAGLRDPTPRILQFTPSTPLAASTTYRVTLDAGLSAADGSQLAEQLRWTFTTAAPLDTLGNQIVFLSDRSGVANLWAMNPDGSGQRQISAELSPVIDYAVSPDGRGVVVADGAVLVRQDADGSDRRLLTADDVLEFDPAWAPDGSRFAFGRAHRETGAGLGLWTRAADGGDDEEVDLPDDPDDPSPTPDPGAPVLRAPRYAPDGSALAFVDTSGRAAILELETGEQASARFDAAGPPVWLPDSSAVLVSGLPNGIDPPRGAEPLPRLDPASLDIGSGEFAALGIGRLERDAASVTPLDLPQGAARPAVSGDALLFVTLRRGGDDAAGELWLAADASDPGVTRRLLSDGGAPIRSGSFGVERGTVVASRDAPAGSGGGGVWVVDTLLGRPQQLSEDGWQAIWLP